MTDAPKTAQAILDTILQLLDAERFHGVLAEVQGLHVAARHIFHGVELDGRIQGLVRRTGDRGSARPCTVTAAPAH